MNEEQNSKSIEILLVEDNPGDIFLTKQALKSAKICNNLSVVMDGIEAMKFLYKENGYSEVESPDVILLDLNLPKKGGREVLDEIKQHPLLKIIPVVIMTTSRDDEDLLQSHNLDASCYITKPIDLEKFAKVVRSIESFWFSIIKVPSGMN